MYLFRDNDRSSLNCASMLKGGWWWKSCGRGLNGLYLNDPQDLTARQGTSCTRHDITNHKGLEWPPLHYLFIMSTLTKTFHILFSEYPT